MGSPDSPQEGLQNAERRRLQRGDFTYRQNSLASVSGKSEKKVLFWLAPSPLSNGCSIWEIRAVSCCNRRAVITRGNATAHCREGVPEVVEVEIRQSCGFTDSMNATAHVIPPISSFKQEQPDYSPRSKTPE